MMKINHFQVGSEIYKKTKSKDSGFPRCLPTTHFNQGMGERSRALLQPKIFQPTCHLVKVETISGKGIMYDISSSSILFYAFYDESQQKGPYVGFWKC